MRVDAILVDSAASLVPALPTEVVRGLDDTVLGRAVLTASGERIGTISGFWVNTADGRIAAYRVHPEAGLLSRLTNLLHHDTFEVPAEQIQALGAAALIVMDAVANVESAGTQPIGANILITSEGSRQRRMARRWHPADCL